MRTAKESHTSMKRLSSTFKYLAVVQLRAIRVLRHGNSIIFIDPPYAENIKLSIPKSIGRCYPRLTGQNPTFSNRSTTTLCRNIKLQQNR